MTDKRMASIMFADIVGYSKMMGINQTKMLGILEDCKAIIEPIVSKFGGEKIKWIGDEIFCEFPLNEKTADCALEIQKSLFEYNQKIMGFKILMRIGIHSGEVAIRENDRYGNTVNVASRIVKQAPQGSIAISGNVYSELKSYPRFQFKKLWSKKLKNIDFKYGLYRLNSGFEPVQKKIKSIYVSLFFAIIVISIVLYQYNIFNIYTHKTKSPDIDKSENILTIPEAAQEFLNKENVKKFITAIYGINDANGLLQYLDLQRKNGILKFGNRDDFYNLNEKIVIVFNSKHVIDVLLNSDNSYISTKENKVLSSLASGYAKQRMIWIHLF